MMLINGFATLTSLKPDLDSLKKLLELGADIHKLIEDDRVKIGDGEEFKDEFVIQQLAECGDTLESLEVALKTRKDNQISMGDPKALKVMAKLGDIEKLMKAVKGCIAEYHQNMVAKVLKDYKEIILQGNDTVIDYNTAIQQLMDARPR